MNERVVIHPELIRGSLAINPGLLLFVVGFGKLESLSSDPETDARIRLKKSSHDSPASTQ